MKYQLKVYSIWEDGQRKDAQGNPHQEDSIYPPYGKEKDSDRLFILCDGMGGHDAGEVASATVCEAMSSSILNDGHDASGIFTQEDFNRALDSAFNALDAKDTGATKKMGTTMTFLKLHNRGATIAHMGDSRVYHIRPGKRGEDTLILKQTEDHSLVNDLVKAGELTHEEARHSRQKNVITRAMQPGMERRPKADVYETSDIKPGDFFYLCSDGMLEQDEMENGSSLKNIFSEMGRDDENRVEILKAVTEGNRDNHSAIIVHILDVIEEDRDKRIPSNGADKIPDKFTAIIEEEEEKPKESPAPPTEDKTSEEDTHINLDKNPKEHKEEEKEKSADKPAKTEKEGKTDLPELKSAQREMKNLSILPVPDEGFKTTKQATPWYLTRKIIWLGLVILVVIFVLWIIFFWVGENNDVKRMVDQEKVTRVIENEKN